MLTTRRNLTINWFKRTYTRWIAAAITLGVVTLSGAEATAYTQRRFIDQPLTDSIFGKFSNAAISAGIDPGRLNDYFYYKYLDLVIVRSVKFGDCDNLICKSFVFLGENLKEKPYLPGYLFHSDYIVDHGDKQYVTLYAAEGNTTWIQLMVSADFSGIKDLIISSIERRH
jgi:hypothetical protein